MSEKASGLPFSLAPLDPNFVPAKPKNSVEESKVLNLETSGNLIVTRKRNGYCHLIAGRNSSIKIYTRGIKDVTAKYPHIVQEISLMEIPSPFLLCVEMLFDNCGKDEFEKFTRIAKSGNSAAVKLQEEIGFAVAMVFGVVVFGGKVVSLETHQERFDLIKNLFAKLDFRTYYIQPVEILGCSFEKAKNLVKEKKWEGLVLYDKTKPSAFRLDGKSNQPPRPEGCWKWKPFKEDDFIVRKWEKGSGKNKNRMGKLYLLQIDSKTEKEINCGEVGIGFTDDEREDFTRKNYPLVVQVKFEERFASGSLRHPVFMRPREDKRPEECMLPVELEKGEE